jgi:hypothetical protein
VGGFGCVAELGAPGLPALGAEEEEEEEEEEVSRLLSGFRLSPPHTRY